MAETRKARAPTLTRVDLEKKENGERHFTNQFEHLMSKDILVIRRGHGFKLTLSFDQHFDASRHDLRFLLKTGDDPRPGNDSYVWFTLSDTPGPHHWDAAIERQNGYSVTVVVTSPPHCIVSQWSMQVSSFNLGEGFTSGQSSRNVNSLYILFNPWCKDDPVYFKEPSKLDEYILNEYGMTISYTTGSKNVSYRPWFYGQFQPGVLDIAMGFLEKGLKGRSPLDMADPVTVSRTLCRMVNAEDENGVIEGRWFEDFPEGITLPWDWTSSVDVLNTFKRHNKPAQYGQCYVFASVLTTLLRAIGIPCRTLSTLNAARDIDANLVVDVYYDKPDHAPGEFTWNFHSWNDVWMKRPDLSGAYSYSDWQALDATPTAPSDGHYRLGPAPLRAIRDGKLGTTYDSKYFFCWLNSTECHWWKLSNEEWAIVDVRRNRPIVLTKTPDGSHVQRRGEIQKKLIEKNSIVDVMENITESYRHSKATRIDGLIFPRALERYRLKSTSKDVDIRFRKKRHIDRGDAFEISLKVSNRSKDSRTVSIDMRCFAVDFLYGRRVDNHDIKQLPITEDIAAGSEKIFDLKILPGDYMERLTRRHALRQTAQLYVKETHQYFYKFKDVVMDQN